MLKGVSRVGKCVERHVEQFLPDPAGTVRRSASAIDTYCAARVPPVNQGPPLASSEQLNLCEHLLDVLHASGVTHLVSGTNDLTYIFQLTQWRLYGVIVG